MEKEWLKNIESGINKYKNEIVPFIKEGNYGAAGMDLLNVVYYFGLAIDKMEEDELCANILVLASRFSFLSKACLDEYNSGNNKKVVKYAFNLTEEKIKEVKNYLKVALIK